MSDNASLIQLTVPSYVLNSMPGVVEHGVFRGLADTVFLAVDGEVQEILSK